MNWKTFFPILSWLPNYQKDWLKGDFIAGLTVGVMLIPQGMAYALIAGLPPVYGLYAALVPQVVYAVFGTSRQLAVGPVAMDSLLVAAMVSTIAVAGTDNYITIAILLAFLMGAVQLLFGVFRLGFLVNFLSRPVINGFTTAAAFIIGLNQVKHIFGIDLPRSSSVFEIISSIPKHILDLNPISLIIGISSVAIIMILKRVNRLIPGALIVVFLGITISFLGDLNEAFGVYIVGEVPSGLPEVGLPSFSNLDWGELLPMALTLGFIAFMEAISVAKAMESKHKGEYKLDNNQEMIALGLGNMIGSIFSSFPTSGGFGRSAVNDASGAKTGVAAIIASVVVLMTLLYLTPLFYYLPKAILGAIILVAVIGLADFKTPKFLWKVNRYDFIMLIGTFIITLVVGIKEGVLAGVGISIATIIYRNTKPHVAILGLLPGEKQFRNVERFEEVETRQDVLVMRYDSPLYFVNAENFSDVVKLEVERRVDDLKFFVLHCSGISYIDATSLQVLEDLLSYLNERNIEYAFSGLIGPVRDFLVRTEFVSRVGSHHFFMNIQSAIDCFDNCDELGIHNSKPAIQSNN